MRSSISRPSCSCAASGSSAALEIAISSVRTMARIIPNRCQPPPHRNPSPPVRERAFLRPSPAVLGGRVDHLADLGDLGGREAADLGVLFDDVLVLGEVDAERLVGRDIAVDPLDVGAELAQHLVRFRRRAAQLLALQAAGAGDVALDDEFAQGHVYPPLIGLARDDTGTLRGWRGSPCRAVVSLTPTTLKSPYSSATVRKS